MKLSLFLTPYILFAEARYKSKSGARCPATCPPCDFPEAVSVGRKKDLPQCKPGTGIFWDECECCRRCASQINEECDLLHPCDETKGLTCQNMDRRGQGICSPAPNSRSCFVKGNEYESGDEFKPNANDCRYTCVCVNGDIGCYPTCSNKPPPEVALKCPKTSSNPGPKEIRETRISKGNGKNDSCCPIWVCPDDPRYNNPNYEWKESVFQAAYRPKPIGIKMVGDCPVQTTEWSPCSRECGWGIRERITNDNEDCEMKKETKLCQLKPCHHVTSIKTMLNSNKYINKACLKTTRPKDPVTYTFSGCKSKRQYKPRYCGLCKDDRCCEPEETETVNVTFECPGNEEIVKQIDQIKKCNCSNKCQSASFDIFASNHFLNNDVQMSNLRH
jgi:hypothetical protein